MISDRCTIIFLEDGISRKETSFIRICTRVHIAPCAASVLFRSLGSVFFLTSCLDVLRPSLP